MVEMYQMQSPKRHFPYTQEFIEAEAEALEKWMQQTDSILAFILKSIDGKSRELVEEIDV